MAKSGQMPPSATSLPDLPYCPNAGDIIWLDFDPQAGREQAGKRPALVLSPQKYNQLTRLCVLCPITSRIKNYPFEVVLPAALDVSGVVLADQVESLSWQARNSRSACRAPNAVVLEVRAKIKALLHIT